MGCATGKRFAPRARTAALALVLLLGRAGLSGAAGVVSADQVCAAGIDPCKVTSVVQVEDGAVLDFGTRAVQLSGSGQFNFGAGSGSILCGPFSAATAGTAINARGTSTEGESESGSVRVEARRLCSAGATELPCVNSAECQLGSCSVRRCSLRPARTCTSDESCTVGPCGTNKRCAGATGILRCNTNADCDYGTCPEQLTCANRASSPVACSADTDCDFGACTSGAASISMGGAIAGNSGFPAIVTLRAADAVSILKAVNLSSTDTEGDGGELSIEAATGGVTVTAKITAIGGSAAQGGSVDLQAGEDAILAEDITVTGGDFDGGSVLVKAGRDVSVSRSVQASATSGAGFGGEILVAAGRDLLVGTAPSNSGLLTASGYTDPSGNAGDGGTMELSAGRHATLVAGSRLTGRGSDPDGNGGQVVVEAGSDARLAGTIDGGSDGKSGAGGVVEISSGGSTLVESTGTFQLAGGTGGGGTLDMASVGEMSFSGSASAAGSGGPGGAATLVSMADAGLSGTLAVAGTAAGRLGVLACRVTLASGGLLDNKAVDGENRLTARESMKLLAGSAMTAPAGSNVLVSRTAAKPPLIQGTVTPVAQTVVDETLPGCPVCGNLEIDAGESCDDGNLTGGDGCSVSCQNEKCLSQTIAPGHPAVALCEDGDPCTADVCNTSLNGGTCQHPAKNCADGFGCTADTCESGVCVHATNDSLCDDGNGCTDDFCSTGTGCQSTANDNACRDGDKCTRDDRCVATVCTGTPTSVCAECGDGVVDESEDCDDGDTIFRFGQECSAVCAWIPCGKPTASSGVLPKAGDALFTLRAAVKLVTCSPRTCDADGSGVIAATDALFVLRAAVGLPVTLRCPD